MSKKIFSLLTLKGKYTIVEKDTPESKINYDVFSSYSWISVRYQCESGTMSSSTANAKIIGFTNNEFNEDSIDLIISFEESIQDTFYEELTDLKCKLTHGEIIHLKSQFSEATDIRIEPEIIKIETFADKKSLTAKEKDIFDKEEKKVHTSNSVLFELLKSKFPIGNWRDLEGLKLHKKFKEEYLSNAPFIRAIIKTYDPEYEDSAKCISEFKSLL